MNNFDKVFILVQKYCSNKDTILKDEDLQKIAVELDLTRVRLHFYLESIRELGLIRYSDKENNVSLTATGMKAGEVFS